MANFQIERLRALPVHRDDEVWEIGFIAIPIPVAERDAPGGLHPVMSVCVSTHGGVAATDPCMPQDMPRSAMFDALARFALDPHMPGVQPLGYLPKRISTAPDDSEITAEFHAALRDLGIEVEVKTSLPALEQFAESLNDHADELIDDLGGLQSPAPGIMRSKGMSVERVRAFADAASVFFRAQPWQHFPNEILWRVQPKPRTRALSHFSIMGAAGEEFGIGFLASQMDMMRMVFHSDPGAFNKSRRSTLWSVTYERIDGLPEQDAELWEREGLPVATSDAYPIAIGCTPSNKLVRPSTEQLTYIEAVLRAAAQLTHDDAKKKKVAIDVSTHDGQRDLKLHVALDLGSLAGVEDDEPR